MKTIRGLLWRFLLASPSVRRRLAWQLMTHYPDDLGARVPLGYELATPLFDAELAASFAEIFFEAEYGGLLDVAPLPHRWIDLGCYAGFFSLWLELQRRRRGDNSLSKALLVDANASLAPWLTRLLEMNQLSWGHRIGAIAPGTGECEFVERTYMASTLREIAGPAGPHVRVPVLTEDEILTLFPPPYDLLKVDIEGAEHALLAHYPRVLSATRWLCLEWHSWHPGGGGAEQLRELATAQGFDFEREIQPVRTLPDARQTGVFLFAHRDARG
jgi:FkbM family methyltransferase